MYDDNKKMYAKDKHMYDKNSMGHNPNDGENQIKFSGNTEGSRDESRADSAGVVDGLSSMEAISVKDAEMVTSNQRPEHNIDKVDGSFTMGVS